MKLNLFDCCILIDVEREHMQILSLSCCVCLLLTFIGGRFSVGRINMTVRDRKVAHSRSRGYAPLYVVPRV